MRCPTPAKLQSLAKGYWNVPRSLYAGAANGGYFRSNSWENFCKNQFSNGREREKRTIEKRFRRSTREKKGKRMKWKLFFFFSMLVMRWTVQLIISFESPQLTCEHKCNMFLCFDVTTSRRFSAKVFRKSRENLFEAVAVCRRRQNHSLLYKIGQFFSSFACREFISTAFWSSIIHRLANKF